MLLSRRQLIAVTGASAVLPWRVLPARAGRPMHAISMYGDLRYPAGFTHFDYVDPNAPKGGAMVLSAVGTFDSLNPFILRGTPGAGITQAFDTLTAASLDEPFSRYGLIAETIEVADDGASVAFNLRPQARWHDGRPLTAEDVVFAFETLKSKGHPRYRAYYTSVVAAEAEGTHRVVFRFEPGQINRELPLIVGDLPVLPKHHYEALDFEKVGFDRPLGSGPYRLRDFVAGRSITHERVDDYWAVDLPVNRGRNNVDVVRYEYFRDIDIALEAFKAGQYDLRIENSASRWATRYTGPAIEQALIRKEVIPIKPPARMQGFIFNLRRPIFQDRRVREAIIYAFDFEWTNKNLTYDAYERITSYFQGDDALSAPGEPTPDELALLEPFRDRVPAEVFGPIWKPPVYDGSGNIRDGLRQALRLLREAGWEVRDGTLTEAATGTPLTFELLSAQASDERLAAPFLQNLAKLGIKGQIRVVDPSQYQNRTDNFDFDMIIDIWAQSSSPGNEQRDFWGSAVADRPGSRNTIGIKDPVVDALIERIIQAPDRRSLEIACHALDRVLLWGFYCVPQFTSGGYNFAWWDKFGMPAVLPTESPDLFSWWVDPSRDQQMASRKEELEPAPQ